MADKTVKLNHPIDPYSAKVRDMGDGTFAEVVAAADVARASLIDSTTTAGYVYFCEAAPGTASSAAAWQISRLNTSTGQTMWADGNGLYDNVADNRASLTFA